MNKRQEVIDRALEAARKAGYANDLSFVVDYLAELAATGRRHEQAEAAKNHVKNGNGSATLPANTEILQIPFIDNFDKWMGCRIRHRWFAVIPADGFVMVTGNDVFRIRAAPYRMFLEYRVLSPVFAAHEITPVVDNIAGNVLLGNMARKAFYAAPRGDALTFLGQAPFANFQVDNDLTLSEDFETFLNDHLELFACELSGVYGIGPLEYQKPDLGVDYLPGEHMFSVYGVN